MAVSKQKNPLKVIQGARSVRKGKRNESIVINLLQPVVDEYNCFFIKYNGFKKIILKRNIEQYRTKDEDDITIGDWIHIEVRAREVLAINTWWKKIKEITERTRAWPVLIYKANRKWYILTTAPVVDRFNVPFELEVTVTLEQFLVLFREVLFSYGYANYRK